MSSQSHTNTYGGQRRWCPSLDVLPAELELSYAQENSLIQGSGCNRLEGKKPRFSEHLLFVARDRNGYFTLNHVPTSRLMIECPYDVWAKLRLRSDVIKALTDSRALEITRKGSKGELTTRL